MARTLAAPAEIPSTSSTGDRGRHAESTHQTPRTTPFGRTTGLCGHPLGRVLEADHLATVGDLREPPTGLGDAPACSTVWSSGREVDDDSVTTISDDHVKVHFRMEIDEGGWPPASVESLWAVDLGDGTVRLDNTPWFVRGVASGDVIRVQPDDDGLLWAGETVEPSQNCTIRLIVLKDSGSAAARQSVLDTFHRLDTTGEGIEQFGMVALKVPPQADLLNIRELLEHGETKEWWHWEEGCVTAAWEATARP
ncbi:DUF4265 domain-containing protein [Streptomyces sp. NPDC052291]|uniref:DUF4265 domain-containing protein n=1 Tax=Streptomyces sp. NPDC052291 TaxID=3161011 RepID=UPI0034440D08